MDYLPESVHAVVYVSMAVNFLILKLQAESLLFAAVLLLLQPIQ